MPSKPKYLTVAEIVAVMKILDKRAKELGVKYALIGGALFKMMGIPGYETTDIDVASDGFLDFPTVDVNRNRPGDPHSVSPEGHYRINDVGVDWMPVGKEGSERLFDKAVRTAQVDHNGISFACLSAALAIKLFAGRDKDREVCWEFVDNGYFTIETLRKIVAENTGKGQENDGKAQ
jgi:hypothetical protein